MHHVSSSKPMLCRELVGRTCEVQVLSEALQRAAAGKPQFIILAGEAGVGKTKLCHALMEGSQARQALILFGQAILQDQALPFGPFLDAFRRYFSHSSGRLTLSDPSLQASFAFLLRLLPELASLFPGVAPLELEISSTPLQQQQVLFHHVLSGLQTLAQVHQVPLLLILEDLHWADETSLELLAFLASRLDDNAASVTSTRTDYASALMIVGTYRTEAVLDNPALKRLLVQLHNRRQGQEVRVAPLPVPDHRRCLSNILEQPVPEQFAHFLFAWDEGNPFFTEELLGAMAATGQLAKQSQGWLITPHMKPPLPSSLTDAILERFTRLSDSDQEVLADAATIGRVFEYPLLAALCELHERELVEVLRRAMNAQLISEVSGTQPLIFADNEQERYQFRHALTREAIYEQMLAPERRRRHQTVAETLEKLVMGTSPGTAPSTTKLDKVARLLAEHYWQAGLTEKARPYALHEAERAGRLFAFREERYYLNMVQASLPRDSLERLHLLHRLGMVSLGIFDLAAALQWLEMAKTGYQRLGRQHQALQVMADMMLPNWMLGGKSVPDMVIELEAAAEAIFHHAEWDVGILGASSLIAAYHAGNCWFPQAVLWIARSVAVFESLTDPGKVAAMQLTFLARGMLKMHQHATVAEEGVAELRSVISAAREYSLPDVILLGYTWLAATLWSWGRSDEAEQVLEEINEYQSRYGPQIPAFVGGWQSFFSGERWEQETELLCSEIEQMEGGAPTLAAVDRVVLAHFALTRNDLSEAAMHLHKAQPIVEFLRETFHLVPLLWGLARLNTAQKDYVQAEAWYKRILEHWKTTEDTLYVLPSLLDGIVFYAEAGNFTSAQAWLTELQTVVQVTDNPVGVAALLEAQGVLDAKEGALEEAIAALRQAVEAWGKLKRRYQQAQASHRLAELLLIWARKRATGRAAALAAREEAESLLKRAKTVYEQLHIPLDLEAIRALRISTHLEAQRKRRNTLLTRRLSEGLTQREMQVLIQLAEGRTNKEMATRLGISVGTVELHVTHVLSKLGCETRTQAAAYAIAKGWVKN